MQLGAGHLILATRVAYTQSGNVYCVADCEFGCCDFRTSTGMVITDKDAEVAEHCICYKQHGCISVVRIERNKSIDLVVFVYNFVHCIWVLVRHESTQVNESRKVLAFGPCKHCNERMLAHVIKMIGCFDIIWRLLTPALGSELLLAKWTSTMCRNQIVVRKQQLLSVHFWSV